MLFFVFVVLPNQQEIAIPQQNKVNGINTGKKGLHMLLGKNICNSFKYSENHHQTGENDIKTIIECI